MAPGWIERSETPLVKSLGISRWLSRVKDVGYGIDMVVFLYVMLCITNRLAKIGSLWISISKERSDMVDERTLVYVLITIRSRSSHSRSSQITTET